MIDDETLTMYASERILEADNLERLWDNYVNASLDRLLEGGIE